MDTKPHLVLCTIALFILLSIVHYFSFFGELEIQLNTRNIIALILFVVGSGCLLLILSYTISILLYRKNSIAIAYCSDEPTRTKPIAILICTRDDWIPEVAERCMQVMSEKDRLFICDDSQSNDFKNKIDAFVTKNSKSCTVSRRNNLTGWKAGNINNCLRHIETSFEYFILVDHDNLITKKMLCEGVSILEKSRNASYVQFSNREELYIRNQFCSDLRASVRSIWWTLSSRAAYGFRFNVGHAAVFRTQDLIDIGLFPESVITEDIALSMKLYNHGKFGFYLIGDYGKESIPETYTRYLLRYSRWCIGTIQCWLNPRIRLRFRKVKPHIYLDAILSTLQLVYALPMLLLITSLGLLTFKQGFTIQNQGIAFRVSLLAAFLIPNIPIVLASQNWRERIKSTVCQSALYLSFIISLPMGIIGSFVTSQIEFFNTGNRSNRHDLTKKFSLKKLFATNGYATPALELAILAFIISYWSQLSIFAVTLLVGILCSLAFRFLKWDSKPINIIKFAPISSIIFVSIILFI